MMRGKFEYPKGLRYQPEFITKEEENLLLQFIEEIHFDEVWMHGKASCRSIKQYGYNYIFSGDIEEGSPTPKPLIWLKDRCASLAKVPLKELEETLITKYPEKAAIGWHRDAPMFGPIVIGVSLLSSCTMRFQNNKGIERKVFEQELLPRSVYILSGPARFIWQHSIPAVKVLRYSITFRTINKKWIQNKQSLDLGNKNA